jgi:hypothetical protein
VPFLTVVEDELQIIGQCTSLLWLGFTQFNLPWILLGAPALLLRHMQGVGPLTCINCLTRHVRAENLASFLAKLMAS